MRGRRTVIGAATGQAPGICVACGRDKGDPFCDHTTGTQVDPLTAGDYTDMVTFVH